MNDEYYTCKYTAQFIKLSDTFSTVHNIHPPHFIIPQAQG